MKIPRSFGTHSGTFHADEVTACALLLLFDLIDEDKIIRSRDPHVLAPCEYTCDVGCIYNPPTKHFDHHQRDYTGHLSSAGMILHYLCDSGVLEKDLFNHIYHRLVKGVDEHDNGKSPQLDGYCTFSHVISNFAPMAYDAEPEDQNKAFFQALKFALGHLERLRDHFYCFRSYRKIIHEEMDKQRPLLVFEEGLPWQDLFFELGGNDHPALFVILPDAHHWKLRGVPLNDQDRMSTRVSLPHNWAGLSGEALEHASGIKGAIFCHKGGFVSVWETKEGALKAYQQAMNAHKHEAVH